MKSRFQNQIQEKGMVATEAHKNKLNYDYRTKYYSQTELETLQFFCEMILQKKLHF
jgi:hypothetical protein